ncbi:MAG: hypothetical protein ACK6EB_42240, partial [Planctomyces sp.]
ARGGVSPPVHSLPAGSDVLSPSRGRVEWCVPAAGAPFAAAALSGMSPLAPPLVPSGVSPPRRTERWIV